MRWLTSSGVLLSAMAVFAFAGDLPAFSRAGAVPPTFSKDVAPILYQHCATCHRAGGSGGFSLVGYAESVSHATQIVTTTSRHTMPPWKPVKAYGQFRDALVLTPAEVEVLRRWQQAGSPQGDATDLPPAPHFPGGWQAGAPDLIARMQQSFSVPATGEDIYECFVIPIDTNTDKYVSAVEFLPGNPAVLHHSIWFLDTSGEARKMAERAGSDHYPCFGGPGFFPSGALGGWSPGGSAVIYPANSGRLLKGNAVLVIQNHYRPGGTAQTDQSTVGIHFAAAAPESRVVSIPIVQEHLDIPANQRVYEVHTTFMTPIDIDVFGVMPHMHLLGTAMRVAATLPDSRTIPLIWVKDWDPMWQREYYLSQSLHLPRGSQIDVVATYDNSSANKHNPNSPPRRVQWGDRSTDEMAMALIDCTVDQSVETADLRKAIVEQPGLK